MPDRFKEFLQNHKEQLDHLSAPKDIFDQVMDHSNYTSNKSSNRKFFISFVSIAASLLLIVLSYFAIRNNSNHPIQNVVSEKSNSIESIDQVAIKVPSNPVTLSNELNHAGPLNLHNNSNLPNHINNNRKSAKLVILQKINNEIKNVGQAQIQDSIKTDLVQHTTEPKADIHTDEARINSTQKKIEDPIQVIASELPNSVNAKLKYNDLNTSKHKYSNEDQLIQRKIRKGLFSFLSIKSRKWSNNALAIDPTSEDKSTSIAFTFKSHNLEFSKSFRINTNQ